MAARKKSLAEYMSPDGFVAQPAEGPIVQDYNFSPGQPFAFDPTMAPTPTALQSAIGVEQPLPEAGTPGDPMALAPKIDQTEIGIQDALDPLTGKGYAGTVRPKVQSFSEADKQTALKNAMGMGLQTTPEMVILGAGMARDKSLLSDKNFEGPNREDMQREQAGIAKAGQESSLQRALAIDPKEVLSATKMVEETPAISEAEKNIADQETALKKLLAVEQSIDTWAKIDMTMSLAFMDELYGTKLVKSYKPYAPPEATIQKLQQHINENKGKLSAQKERMYSDLLKDKDVKGRESSIQGTRSVTELPPGTMAAKTAAANRPSSLSASGLNPYQEATLELKRAAQEQAKRIQDADLALAQEKARLEKAKDDSKAKLEAEKFLGSAEASRIITTLDQIDTLGNKMVREHGKLPGTGAEGMAGEWGVGGLMDKIGRTYGSLSGDEATKAYYADKTMYDSAKNELGAAVKKYYSGAAATDAETKVFHDILGQVVQVDPETYRKNLMEFKKRFTSDLKLRMSIIESDPRLSAAVQNVKIGDMATLNQMLNASSPEGNLTVPERDTNNTITPTPQPKKKVSEEEIDELLK